MPNDARAIANEFLKLAKEEGKQIDPMKLQKLVFFAHGWHLALMDRPLINEKVEAWRYGPVIPSLYHEFKTFGNGPITECATVLNPERTPSGSIRFFLSAPEIVGPDTDSVRQLIKRVWDVYGKLSGIQLSNLTHALDSPWAKTPDKEIRGTDISDEDIKAYFVNIARQNAQRAVTANRER